MMDNLKYQKRYCIKKEPDNQENEKNMENF